jgi:hypothetical protein
MANSVPPHVTSLLFDDRPEDRANTRPENVMIVLDVTATNDGQVTRLQAQEGPVTVNPAASIVDFICLDEAYAMTEIHPCYGTYAKIGSIIVLPNPDTDTYHYRVVSHSGHGDKPKIIQQRKGLQRVRRHMELKGVHILHIMPIACLQLVDNQQINDICGPVFRGFPSPPGKELQVAISHSNWKRPTERELRYHAKTLLKNRKGADSHTTTKEDKAESPFNHWGH